MIVRVSNEDDFGKSRYFGEKYKSETRRSATNYSQIWSTAQWVQIEIIYCASKIDLEFGDT